MKSEDATQLRVGVDLCEVSAVASSIDHFGDRYLRRLFTDHELSTCLGSANSSSRLAARFAAKEATIKILRPVDHIPMWRSIEVRTAVDGSCSLALSGYARLLAECAGIGEVAVSITHEGPLAGAVVVALCVEEEASNASNLLADRSIEREL